MKWPPTLCWTAPKTINGNRHFQVKAYGGKNEDRWGNDSSYEVIIYIWLNKKKCA